MFENAPPPLMVLAPNALVASESKYSKGAMILTFSHFSHFPIFLVCRKQGNIFISFILSKYLGPNMKRPFSG